MVLRCEVCQESYSRQSALKRVQANIQYLQLSASSHQLRGMWYEIECSREEAADWRTGSPTNQCGCHLHGDHQHSEVQSTSDHICKIFGGGWGAKTKYVEYLDVFPCGVHTFKSLPVPGFRSAFTQTKCNVEVRTGDDVSIAILHAILILFGGIPGRRLSLKETLERHKDMETERERWKGERIRSDETQWTTSWIMQGMHLIFSPWTNTQALVFMVRADD